MTNSKLLRDLIDGKGIKISYLAKSIGICRPALYSKINNEREFTASEILKLSEILGINLKEREKIFFANEVVNNNHT